MALEIPERAVVGHDLEAVAQGLQAAARAVAAVAALAHEVGQQLALLLGRQRGHGDARLLLDVGRLEQQRGQQPLDVAVDLEQPHRRSAVAGRAIEPQARHPVPRRLLAALQVGDPLAAASGRSTRATKLGMTALISSRIIRP